MFKEIRGTLLSYLSSNPDTISLAVCPEWVTEPFYALASSWIKWNNGNIYLTTILWGLGEVMHAVCLEYCARWVLECYLGGVGSGYAGESSSSLYPSERNHCNPFFKEQFSNLYVKSIVVKGNSCATLRTILKVKSVYLGWYLLRPQS